LTNSPVQRYTFFRKFSTERKVKSKGKVNHFWTSILPNSISGCASCKFADCTYRHVIYS